MQWSQHASHHSWRSALRRLFQTTVVALNAINISDTLLCSCSQYGVARADAPQ